MGCCCSSSEDDDSTLQQSLNNSPTASAASSASVFESESVSASASESESASGFASASASAFTSAPASASASEFSFASAPASESASASASAFASVPPSGSAFEAVQFSDGEVPPFSNFSFSVLKIATKNFSSDNIISKIEENPANIVYKGRLSNNQWIAVKKFKKITWPVPTQFAEEAQRVGKLRHKRLTNLIGYCCEGDQRLLIAEFMPRNTLSNHLFHCMISI